MATLPAISPQTLRLGLAAAGAALVLGVAAYLLLRSDAEPEEKGRGEEGAKASAPTPARGAAAPAAPRAAPRAGPVTKELLLVVMRDMLSSMRTVVEERDSFKNELLASGRSADEAEEEAAQAMQARMAVLDQELQVKHGITQDALMTAQEAHADDEDVETLMTELKELIVGKEQAEAMARMAALVPASMTVETYLPKFKAHMMSVEGRVADLYRQAATETRGLERDERERYCQLLMMRSVEEMQVRALEAAGMEGELFQGCMMKFARDPRFAELINASQARQDALREKLFH